MFLFNYYSYATCLDHGEICTAHFLSAVRTVAARTTFPNRNSTPKNAKLSDPRTETFVKTNFTDATMSKEEMMAVNLAPGVAAISNQYDGGTEE